MARDLGMHLLTPDRWPDLEALFGQRGAPNECWCMWWRVTRAEWQRQKGEGNRLALKRIVESGEVPGLLAYADGRSVGWVSVGPRESFPSLNRSSLFKRVDDRPAWSIVCFFIDRAYRGIGVAPKLLTAATDYALAQGAKVVEGYPKDPSRRLSGVSAYMGLRSMFQGAGFVEVLRRSPDRPIMRRFA